MPNLLDVVGFHEQLKFGFCLGKESVGNATLQHLVENGKYGIPGLGILAQGLDSRNGKPLLEDFVDAGCLLYFHLQRICGIGVRISGGVDLGLQVTVLGELMQVLFQVFADAVGLVGIVFENGADFFFGTLALNFDFLFGLGNVEVDGRYDGTGTELAQVGVIRLHGDILVGEQEYGDGRNQYAPEEKMKFLFLLFHLESFCS